MNLFGDEMTALPYALNALSSGEPLVRLPVEWTGVGGKVADAFNDVVELNERMARHELGRLSFALSVKRENSASA